MRYCRFLLDDQIHYGAVRNQRRRFAEDRLFERDGIFGPNGPGA